MLITSFPESAPVEHFSKAKTLNNNVLNLKISRLLCLFYSWSIILVGISSTLLLNINNLLPGAYHSTTKG